MNANKAPIWRDAQRLLLLVEQGVRRLPAYHNYRWGSDLRHQAMLICGLVNRAWRDPKGRLRHGEHLVMAVDDFKLLLQVGKEVRASAGFGQLQQVVVLAEALGRQSGGWCPRLIREPTGHRFELC